MSIPSGNKKNSGVIPEMPDSDFDLTDKSDEAYLDEAYQLEIASLQNDEVSNFDDALDDDNENPVSHTLVDAAENSGTGVLRDTQELEGEELESQERKGN